MKYCTCYVSLFNNVVHIFVSYINDDRFIYSSSSTIFSLFVIEVDPIFKLCLLEMKKSLWYTMKKFGLYLKLINYEFIHVK